EIPPDLLEWAENDQGDEGGSQDSRDTVERLADQVQDLEDANQEFEKKVDILEADKKALTEQVVQLNGEIEVSTERIEFLEEAEQRWRDKLTKARLEIERLLQVNERASFVSADRECGLIVSLLDARNLRNQIAVMKRRRAKMLDEMEKELAKRQRREEDTMALHVYQRQAAKDAAASMMMELEARRRREVAELQEQLSCERIRIAALEAAIPRLEGKLRMAAHRLLERSMSTKAWPAANSYALRAWCGIHPAVVFENKYDRTLKLLEETRVELDQFTQRCGQLEGDLKQTTLERDAMTTKFHDLEERFRLFKEEAGLDEESMKKKREAVAAKEAAWWDKFNAVVDEFAVARQEFAAVKDDLELQLKAVESRLTITEAALAAASGKRGGGGDPDAFRVVPKGTGVLCVGCLSQLVLRAVKPIPPKLSITASSPDLEIARRTFFGKELAGTLSADDPSHNYMYNSKKDPYGMKRLTAWPSENVLREPTSPSASDLSPVATTGLPALKKERLNGGKVSMVSSMKDFRPRAFR
ncbi:unnamed protein product, partial [Polarella glacialis]